MRRYGSTLAALLLGFATGEVARADGTAIVVEPAVLHADVLEFDVRLDSDGEVAGTINDLVFDPAAPIRARENGRPDCVVNDSIEKGATTFAFLPDGCAPGACTGVRAIVFSIENVSPIRSGSVLYSCALAADAAPGRYALQSTSAAATDPSGGDVAATCTARRRSTADVHHSRPDADSRAQLARCWIGERRPRRGSGDRGDLHTDESIGGAQNDLHLLAATTSTRPPLTPTLPSGAEGASSSGSSGCAIDPSAGDGAWWLLLPLLWRRRSSSR